MGIRDRLRRIEEKIGIEKTFLLIKHSDSVDYEGRTFDTVEDAVETLEKEMGRKIKATVVNIVYDGEGE